MGTSSNNPKVSGQGIERQVLVAESHQSKTVNHDLHPVPANIQLETDSQGSIGIILDKLVELSAGILEVDRSALDTSAELGDFGFDSVVMTTFASRVNDKLGTDLSPADFFEFSTLESLAKHIVQNTKIKATEEFVAKADVLSIPDNSLESSSPGEDLDDPIVIVGYHCHFPGARNIDEFWQNLMDGRDAISKIPADRWDWRAIDGDPKIEPGKTNIHWGGFCDDLWKFDPAFFNISPREALLMDPQQRLLMTCVWKTLEDAGHDPTSFAGKKIGIFAGTAASDYRQIINKNSGDEGYIATGSVASIGPNRMSYFLDLHGPSEPIETACSSSLVALHRAVNSIKNGECEAALAGGVNTMITPDAHINFSKAGMLSPDGRCKSFSNDANGYVRGEGVGFVMLKPLSAAKRDGNRIIAIVKASGINHGGHANSLTAPNTRAQASLLRDTYESSQINPRDIGYIEAHGTGTKLGDPVEVNALKSVFSDHSNGSDADPRTHYIGTVKSNIGHLELAAGIAGIIKSLLQIEHKKLVPTLHCNVLNTHIELDETSFKISRKLRDWKPFYNCEGEQVPRLAAVSSFGFGGVNAHVVLEEYCDQDIAPEVNFCFDECAFPLSAKTNESLEKQAQLLLSALSSLDNKDINNLAYTLQVGRAQLSNRLIIIASNISELSQHLGAYISGKFNKQIMTSKLGGEDISEFSFNNETSELKKLAARWVTGQHVDWSARYKRPYRRLRLPTYVFSGKDYHIGLSASKFKSDIDKSECFDGYLRADAFYFRDHEVRGQKILPGSMALEVVRSNYLKNDQFKPIKFKNISWLNPLTMSEGVLHPQINFTSFEENSLFSDFKFTDADNSQMSYMRGRICELEAVKDQDRIDVTAIQSQLARQDITDFYEKYRSLGIIYGPSFQVVKQLYAHDGRVLARLEADDEVCSGEKFVLHPAILDGAFHAALNLFAHDVKPSLALPVGIETLEVYKPLKYSMWASLSLVSVKQGLIKFDIDLTDSEGVIALKVKSFTLKSLTPDPEDRRSKKSHLHQPSKQHAEISFYLTSMLSEYTDTPLEEINFDSSLERYGIDSLLISRMLQKLEKDFGDMPPTLFYDHFTLGSLRSFLIEKYPDHNFSEDIKKSVDKKLMYPSHYDDNQQSEVHSHGRQLENEDVAIIGLAGRYPQAENIDEFWQQLVAGNDCITPIPSSRWDHGTLTQRAKKSNLDIKSRWGGFIENPDHFDPLFFNISPADASYMDPQERLFLQCAWETIEDAGYTRENLAPMSSSFKGGDVGVFVGVMWQEYQLYGAEQSIKGSPIAMSSNGASVANRVSYFGNFHGPSIMLDTMCSSSLTAIHLAIQSIQSGSCSVALAGGVNLSTHPNKYIGLAQANFLSSNGRCMSFGEGGDGYVPSEGVGCVLLKPLKKAIADRDHIYGVIRGSAINHGGKVNGYTVPNPHAQEAVIHRALDLANVDPSQVGYVEAHGTGTSLGDPIEITALTRAFSHSKVKRKDKCSIGSVKSNIGHAESAAGIAGLTKILLQFKYNQLVPSIHSESINNRVPLTNSPFKIQNNNQSWMRETSSDNESISRIAGLSSFGAGGSNAHFVIEDYHQQDGGEMFSGPFLVPFSAHDEKALNRLLVKFQNFSSKLSESNLPSVAYTLQVGREAFAYRLAFLVGSLAELLAQIHHVVSGGLDACGQLTNVFYSHNSVANTGQSHQIGDDGLVDQAHSWVQGSNFDWNILWLRLRPLKISLPSYPFAKESYWIPGERPLGSLQSDERIRPMSSTLLFEPFWLPQTSQNAPTIRSAIKHHLVLCHLPSDHVSRIKNLQLSSELHSWHSGKADVSANCFHGYAYALMELLKKIAAYKDVKTRVHFIVNSEQGGQYLSGLSGMLRSAALEIPALSAHIIDYDTNSLDQLISAFEGELQANNLRGQIRYRAGKRYEHFWKEVPDLGHRKLPWKTGGVYLITGGAKGIGLHIAKDIAKKNFDSTLWLIGRSSLSETLRGELESLNANVNYRQLDISSYSAVHALIAEIIDIDGKINGVIHSAGLTRDGGLRSKTSEQLQDVLTPKLYGIECLDQAIGNMPLDFMLLMSSISGALGNVGQTDYAAANAFLDGFASVRNGLRKNGQRQGHTISINWPYWREGGMKLTDSQIKSMASSYGVLPLELGAAFDALYRVFSYPKIDQALILSGELDSLREMMSSLAPVESDLFQTKARSELKMAQDLSEPKVKVNDKNTISQFVLRTLSEVLDISIERFDHSKSFDLYGVDSVSSVSILERLQSHFGLLSQSLLFDYSNIKELVGYLNENYGEENKFINNSVDPKAGSQAPSEEDTDQRDNISSPWLEQTPSPWICSMGEGQKPLWIAQLIAPESSVYNVPMAFEVQDLDENCLTQACRILIDHYPILRARVDDKRYGKPYLLAENIDQPLDKISILKDMSPTEFFRYRSSIPFDLSKPAKIRFELIKDGSLADKQAYLLVIAHHLVIDAKSMSILAAKLWDLYKNLMLGKDVRLLSQANALDYSHYIGWEQSYLKSVDGKKDLQYWREQQKGDKYEKLALPFDLKDHPKGTLRPETIEYRVSSELLSSVKQACRSIGISPASFFLGIFAGLLGKYSGQNRFNLGIASMRRPEKSFEDTVGYFANMIPLKVQIDRNTALDQWFKALHNKLLTDLSHAKIPYSKISSGAYEINKDLNTSVYQATFCYLQLGGESDSLFKLGSSTVKLVPKIRQANDTMIGVDFFEHGQGLDAVFSYDSMRFSQSFIEVFMDHFHALLKQALERPKAFIHELDILSGEEKKNQLKWAQGMSLKHKNHRDFVDLIRLKAKQHPKKIAIYCERKKISYQKMMYRVNQLAHYLVSIELKPGDKVAVLLDRDSDSIITLLAVMSIGAVWIPLDIDAPSTKHFEVIKSSEARFIISHTRYTKTLIRCDLSENNTLFIDKLKKSLETKPGYSPDIKLRANSPAYIIFTSGSTGKPKGVVISRAALSQHVYVASKAYRLCERDVVLQFAAHSTDTALEQILPALSCGARLVMLKDRLLLARNFFQILQKKNITIADIPPSYFRELLQSKENDRYSFKLRLILLGGEALTPSLIKQWQNSIFSKVKLLNAYGPTEATITALIHEVEKKRDYTGAVPIGRPLGGMEAYILDDNHKLIPEGVKGQLYLAGSRLATGYLDDEKLTKERFVTVDIGNKKGPQRLYATGDIVSYLKGTKGQIVFHGRMDNQVKIRGFRVELGEIEAAIGDYVNCNVAAVSRQSISGDTLIVAYIAPSSKPFGKADLRNHLKSNLPKHMRPHHIVYVESLPLSSSGKVDKTKLKNLPLPAADDHISIGTPQDEMEYRLLSLWRLVLNDDSGEQVESTTTPFEDCGGDSLSTLRLMDEISKSLGIQLSYADLQEAPTISQQSRLISRKIQLNAFTVPEADSTIVPLKVSAHSKRSLFLLHPISGDVTCYKELAKKFPSNISVYGIRVAEARGGLDLRSMAKNYITTIKKKQPNGPYLIAGWSFGGLLAYELAQILLNKGDIIEFIGLLDSYPSDMLVQNNGLEINKESLVNEFTRDLLGLNPNFAFDEDPLTDIEGLADRFFNNPKMSLHLKSKDLKALYDNFEMCFKALRVYEPKPAPGLPITLFQTDSNIKNNVIDRWQMLCESRKPAYHLPGDHYSFLHNEFLDDWVENLVNEICKNIL